MLEYPYPLLEGTIPFDDLGFDLASLADLAAMKLSAVAQRGSVKDFLDIYAISRSGLGLQGMMDHYRRKYDVEDISHLLYGLSYFDDADQEPLPTCLGDMEWESVKGTIRSWVRELAD
jgi:hypothetical protein